MTDKNFFDKGFYSFWVRRYKVSFLIIFLIIINGAFSLYSIPKESSPDIKIGVISIFTSYPGVNPTDIDSQITEKIEKEIKDIDGIKKITSTSSVGISSIALELYNGVNSRDVMTDVSDKIDTINLPSDSNDPIITEISSSNELMFLALLYGDREKFDDFKLNNLAKKIEDKLEGNFGIVSLDVGAGTSYNLEGGSAGEKDYDIKILVSKSKLEILGLSINEIANKIRVINKNLPIGNYTIGELNYDFRFEGELSNIEELENLIVRRGEFSEIRLKDIATIKKEYDTSKINYLGFFNESSYNYISLGFNKETGANIFSVSKLAKEEFEKLIKNDSDFTGLSVKYVNDMSEVILEDYGTLLMTGLSTLILIFLVIYLFVGLRESLIASLLFPLSFLITFSILDLLGLSLNFLTNFSLILTLGIAIDTIIVIIEGAAERQRLGYGRSTAVLLAIKDLKAPLISSTLTTLVAFLPLMFLPGIMGKFLSYIPITIFSTLLASLVLSLTVSSTLFIKLAKKMKFYHSNIHLEESLLPEEIEFLETERKGKINIKEVKLPLREKILESLGEKYFKILEIFIETKATRIASIFVPILALILTFIFLSPKIGFILFPPTDNSVLLINIEGKTGINEKSLTKYIPLIDKTLSSIPEMKVYYTTISGNSISINVELLEKNFRKNKGLRNVFEVEEEISSKLNELKSIGLKVETDTLSQGPPSEKPIGIKLIASDNKKVDELKKVATDFESYLKTITGVKNITTTSKDNPGQFIFKFNYDKLDQVGISTSEILSEISAYTSSITAGSIKSDFGDNDIKLSVAEFEDNLSPEDINNLIINTRIGKIRVGDFVNFEFTKSLSSINREDGKIVISVESNLDNGILPTEVQPKLLSFAQSYNYPSGITFSAGGETESNMDLIVSTIKSFFIALFLIFSILVFQFNSYKQPLIILYSVILAFFGVNIGLYLTGNPYSMPFGIGFIALTGVVVNDAIILVDRINVNIAKARKVAAYHGKSDIDYYRAILEAGKSRLQPILVTTLTTIFGILPLALQDEFWAGLGFTIVFGLLAGSFMTLFIIPSLYYTFVVKLNDKK